MYDTRHYYRLAEQTSRHYDAVVRSCAQQLRGLDSYQYARAAQHQAEAIELLYKAFARDRAENRTIINL